MSESPTAPVTASSDPTRKDVLVLQGGGALGSYQAGAYSALCDYGHTPAWVAGISIGAINAAIIAGNPPKDRAARLKDFWELASSPVMGRPFLPGEQSRSLFHQTSSLMIAAFGVPGFFTPRFPPPAFWPPGTPQSLSFYDTAPLRDTLLKFVDFDLINARNVRLSVGAVNVKTGNFAYFDSARQTIVPEHIMASAALPPGFPPIEIDGEYYWDGGLVSNTPLDYVIDTNRYDDLTIFQIDLFNARGEMPTSVLESVEREKDIRFSSRTRMSTDKSRAMRRLRRSVRELIKRLPSDMHEDPLVESLRDCAHDPTIEIVHLIYRHRKYESNSKDYDFSRFGMLEHWASGAADVGRSLKHSLWLHRKQEPGTLMTYDLTGAQPGHEIL